MKWFVDWSPAADRDVLHMPLELGTRLCRAVILLAEQGVGAPEATDRPGVMRLRVRGGVALFRAEAATRTLHVERLYTTR